eukprot:gene8145-786_t
MEQKRAKLTVTRATSTAPVNIAVIKYWGKRDTKLILPINSSLSGTLDQNELHTRTTVAASDNFTEDEIWLNGKKEDISNPRLQNVLHGIRGIALTRNQEHPLKDMHIKIVSVNNFPTAAGLASSAAGYACLVAALSKIFGVADEELSAIARVGSGSACRSLMGGFVRWEKGHSNDGTDSLASQVVPETHWPDMQVLILVVNAGKKGTSSTTGMQATVNSSSLINYRSDSIVPQRMKEIEEAIQKRDFQTFGRITMQDSNQFHATCLDTYPPIFYMNDISRQIIQLLIVYNAAADEIRAAYTFDAGPNCVIYCLKQHVTEIIALIAHFFPPETNVPEFIRGRSNTAQIVTDVLDAPIINKLSGIVPTAGGINYVIHTGIGPGPQTIEDEELQLIDIEGKIKSQQPKAEDYTAERL